MTIVDNAVERTYTIGEFAAVTGMSVHTLRWYESQGLFPRAVPRTSGGRRVFNDEAVAWLALLSRLRASGMPISEVARYANLVRNGDGNEAERVALMEAHARSLDAQIEELLECRAVICGKVDSYRQALASRGVALEEPGIAVSPTAVASSAAATGLVGHSFVTVHVR